MRLYCIFDEKARSVCAVFQSLSDEAAVRSFEHLITAPEDNVFTLSFSDFSVKFIGEFNADVVSALPTVMYGSSFSDSVIASKRIERQHLISQFKPFEDSHAETLKLIDSIFDELDTILVDNYHDIYASSGLDDSDRDYLENFYFGLDLDFNKLKSKVIEESNNGK